jgi:ribosome maturation factor RimP
MISAQNTGLVDRITEMSERAAIGTSIEIVEVQLRGSGGARLLRVYIDKPGGVTHGDCEFISERLGKLLDDEDPMQDGSYTLEVSSPGLERNLVKPRDFERVLGKKLKLALRQPIEGRTQMEGKLTHVAEGMLDLEKASGELLHVPLDQVQKATLKFDW